MRTLWPTLLILSLCWVEPASAQRGPDQPAQPPRSVEVEPRGERGTEAPEADATRDGGGVTIGEPQTIGRPQAIGSPQAIGTPQVIGGERAGGEFPERESQTGTSGADLLGEVQGSPDTSQAYGGSSDVPMEAGSGTGGSEAWVPGQDQVEAEPPDPDAAPDAQPGTGGSQPPADAPAAEVAPFDQALEDGDADLGWTQPEPDEEAWGGTEWMQQDADAPDVTDAPDQDPQGPGVGGSGVPGTQTLQGQGGAGADGGSAGGDLLSPGFVMGPHDPETGALIDPRTGQPQFAQSAPGAAQAPGQQPAQTGDAAGSQGEAAQQGSAATPTSREAPLEDALDSLTEMNEASVELEEAQLEVLESQLARQEAAEAARWQDEEAAILAARQRLVAARMLEQGELALADGETDLSDELAGARNVLVQELELAQSAGRYGDLRELGEALERLDAAEVAADANNALEARRWLLEARRLLVAPAGRGPAVETPVPYP